MTASDATQNQIAHNAQVHDRIADKYDRHHLEIFNEREQARLGRALAEAVAAVRSAPDLVSALDMGCGSGNLTRHLLALGCTVTAADVSHKFLNLVEGRFGSERLRTSQLNGVDLSQFADASFDLIATYSVLHHIPDYLAAVREMGRVCRPGGVVYIDHEMVEHVYQSGSGYAAFRARALRPDIGKWLRPINYYGKLRRLFDPKFANEGDIHVWPDDHIEWCRIVDTLGDSFEPVLDREYLLFDGRYRPEVYDAHATVLTDMRVLALRKR